MKHPNKTLVLGLTLLVLASPVFSQRTLDEAVAAGLDRLLEKFPRESVIVVMGFSAPTKELSGYLEESIIALIARDSRVRNVERARLDMVRQELDFQMSGEVSEETTQSIGRITGAEFLITGSFTSLNKDYSLILQAVRLESAEQLSVLRITGEEDSTIRRLLGKKGLTPLAAGFANLALGLGSYMSGDIAGGLIITAGYGVSAGLILYDILAMSYEDKLAGILAPIGIGTAALTAVFGFVRPYFFQKNETPAHAGIPPGFSIALTPGEESPRLSLMYAWSF